MTTGSGRDIREIERPNERLLWVYLAQSLFLGPFFFIVFVPLCFRYATLKYRFDDEGVAMSWGMFWRREIYLTYARIQDIHLSSGVVERWLGLATIEIQTAAATASAEMSLVGIPEFAALRDFLYQRMRGAKGVTAAGSAAAPVVGGGANTFPSGAAATAAAASDAEVVQLLTEIRDSVRRMREKAGGEA